MIGIISPSSTQMVLCTHMKLIVSGERPDHVIPYYVMELIPTEIGASTLWVSNGIFNSLTGNGLLILTLLIAEGGASSIPCTDTFAGPYAFSEIETQTLSNYYSSIADKITLYLSFHSYGKD